jgi:hypothetical protein
MHTRINWTGWILIATMLSLLVACGAEPTPIPAPPTASATTIPQATPPPAPPTSIPTFAPPPQQVTVEAPTPLPNVQPRTVENLIGPDDFAPDVNPLTGRTAADLATLDRRPIAVKISNSPAQFVRPQSGLNRADLVFEHYAEGGVTRLTAVYYSQGADAVGSVRSARLIDLEIPAMLQSAFAYSGSSAGVQARIRASDFFDRVISPELGFGEPYFFRVPREGVPFEHTLFANLSAIWDWLARNNMNARPALEGLAFSEALPAGGSPATRVFIGYVARESRVEWVYTAGAGTYLRWQGGQPHSDALTGEQLSAANVVVVSAHHQETDFLEDNVGGGHFSIEIQIWGEGPATLFRDGQRLEGRWQRTDRNTMLAFHDLNGAVLPFKPGNTWFQVVPLGFDQLEVSE